MGDYRINPVFVCVTGLLFTRDENRRVARQGGSGRYARSLLCGSSRATSRYGVTVSVAVFVTPAPEAVMVTVVAVVTTDVFTKKPPVVYDRREIARGKVQAGVPSPSKTHRK